MTPWTDRIVFCDHCGPCERRGCNEHEVVTGPAPTPRTDRETAALLTPEEGLREAARAVCDSVRWKGGEPFYTPSSVAYYDALRALARALGDSR